MSVPGATIRAMSGELERLSVPGTPAAVDATAAVLAGELLGRVRAELPVIGELGERDQVLVSAWLTSLRSARTRRAYAADVVAWLGWLAGRGTGALAAGRVHVDLWAATQLDGGAAASSVRRRLSALSSFYRYCAAHDLIARVPTDGVARQVVDPDYTATVGLDRDQARALVAAADADTGPQPLRTAAVVRLLLHNALRVDEACAADIADLGEDSGHRVLRVVRKGGRKAKIPLTPATVAALEAYLTDRAQRAGAVDWRQLSGPLLATAAGGRLRQGHLWELVRRLARTARVGAWEQLSPHSLRHSAITFALDAGASLRDVQDYAGHKDPRTTRRQKTPATAWTATPPTPSLPIWRDNKRGSQRLAGPGRPPDRCPAGQLCRPPCPTPRRVFSPTPGPGLIGTSGAWLSIPRSGLCVRSLILSSFFSS
jgi:integrase/recombinase XerD